MLEQENKDIDLPNEGEDTQVLEQKSEDRYAEKAMQMGWRPQDEWDGDPEDWVDAREYIGRQKLYDRIQDSNKRLKNMEKTLHEFKQHHEKVKETEYKRALDLLKAQKARALEEGEHAEVIELDDKIDLVKDQLKEAQQAPKQPDVDPDFQRTFTEWQDRNGWYRSDPTMKKEADMWGYAYVQLNGAVAPDEVLREIEKEMKRRHPDKFMNPKKNEVSKVETAGGKGKGGKSSGSDVELSEEETQAMKRFVRQGVMTEAQYKQEIKKMRESA